MDQSDQQHPSLLERAKDATLKYSGYAYMIGDAALFAHGVLNKNVSRALTGLTWGAGGVTLAAFGKQSPEYQLKRLTQDLGRHLQSQGVQLPPQSELSRETLASHGVLSQIERFFYDYPSQILNTVYATGGAALTHSGLKRGSNRWEAASGILVTTGALAGLLIPEKEKDVSAKEHTPSASLLSDPIGWVREKPLRFSGAMYSLNNAAMLMSGYREMSDNPSNKTYLLKYLTVASFLLANSLLGASHKDRDNEESQVDMDALTQVAAEAIAAQPPEAQDVLLQDVASYLASHRKLDMDATELADALKQQLATRLQKSHIQHARLEGRISPITTLETQR